MTTLGGSMFVRNAIKYDYCLTEALTSLSECCDKVVILECGSEDETLALLLDLEARLPNVTVHTGGDWECAPKYHRLAVLANQAREMLDTDWHFMLQADEVIHEGSYEPIRKAVNQPGQCDSFLVNRINLYGGFDRYVPHASGRAPCGSRIVRLAKQDIEAFGDAENLRAAVRCDRYCDLIQVFHYGFVRDPVIMCDKVIDMTTWFHGTPSEQMVEHKQRLGRFDYREYMPEEALLPMKWAHPAVAEGWIQERKGR